MKIKKLKLSLMSLISKDEYTSHVNIIANTDEIIKETIADYFSDMILEAAFINNESIITHIGFFITLDDDTILSSSISAEDFNIIQEASTNVLEDVLHVMFTKQTIKALEEN